MSFGSFPAPGGPFRVPEWRALIEELRPFTAGMGSDQPLTSNSSTLQDITEMFLAVDPADGPAFEFEAMVFYTSGTTADIKFAWTFAGGNTLSYGAMGLDTSLAFSQVVSLGEASASAKSFGGAGTSSTRFVYYRGGFAAVAAGNLQLQAAQNTPTVEVENVKAGSWMRLWKSE